MCRTAYSTYTSRHPSPPYSSTPECPSPLRKYTTPGPSFPLRSPPLDEPEEVRYPCAHPDTKPSRTPRRPIMKSSRRTVSDNAVSKLQRGIQPWSETRTDNISIDGRKAYSKSNCCLMCKERPEIVNAEHEAQCLHNADVIHTFRKAKTVDFADTNHQMCRRPKLKTTESRNGILFDPIGSPTLAMPKSDPANVEVTKADVQVFPGALSHKRNDSHTSPDFETDHWCNSEQKSPLSSSLPERTTCDHSAAHHFPIPSVSSPRNAPSHSPSSSTGSTSDTTFAPRSLERVNRKLDTWSHANPPIFILPSDIESDPSIDDDASSTKVQYEVSIHDHDDQYSFPSDYSVANGAQYSEIPSRRLPQSISHTPVPISTAAPAPPNSRLASNSPSRYPSRPISAPLTRAASQEDIEHLAVPVTSTLLQYEDTWPIITTKHHIGARRASKTFHYPTVRTLSQLPQVEEKNWTSANWPFRLHRDSLTLARARMARKAASGRRRRSSAWIGAGAANGTGRKGSVFSKGNRVAEDDEEGYVSDDDKKAREDILQDGEEFRKRPRSIRWASEGCEVVG